MGAIREVNQGGGVAGVGGSRGGKRKAEESEGGPSRGTKQGGGKAEGGASRGAKGRRIDTPQPVPAAAAGPKRVHRKAAAVPGTGMDQLLAAAAAANADAPAAAAVTQYGLPTQGVNAPMPAAATQSVMAGPSAAAAAASRGVTATPWLAEFWGPFDAAAAAVGLCSLTV